MTQYSPSREIKRENSKDPPAREVPIYYCLKFHMNPNCKGNLSTTVEYHTVLAEGKSKVR